MDIRQEIIRLLSSVDDIRNSKLIDDLDRLGYFTSPASKNKHLNIKGGLALHSYNVYLVLKDMNERYNLELSDRFIIVVGLLHDICKVGTYKDNILKNGKVSEKVPYIVEDLFPIGHGEKSVIMLNYYFQLTDEEMMAIRYHLGSFTFSSLEQWNITREQIKKTDYWIPVIATHIADMTASQLLEHNELYIEVYKNLNTSSNI